MIGLSGDPSRLPGSGSESSGTARVSAVGDALGVPVPDREVADGSGSAGPLHPATVTEIRATTACEGRNRTRAG